MAEYANREHFIPLRKDDLIRLLCKDQRLTAEDGEAFRQFSRLVGAVFHYEYLEKLEDLKDAYAPFDPDRDTKVLEPLPAERREERQKQVFTAFTALMERANFKHLTRADIDAAIENGASDWGLNMSVDFAVFDQVEAYVRGGGKVERVKQHPIFFWRKEALAVDAYQRMVLLLKFKKHKKTPRNVDTEHIFFKLFKDIPKLDLEMVFPGAQIQMPGLQKGKLGASLAGTVGYLGYSVGMQLWMAIKSLFVATTATLTAGLWLLWGPAVALAGYGYKQWYSYQVTKQTYSKQLTESLYFQTLDNNAGVLTRLIDESEEQECRETLLAYYFLWKHAPAEGWSTEQLDDYVEIWLESQTQLKVDFEIGDAVAKLERLGIVEKDGERYRARPIAGALETLDHTWDNYFQYNKGI
jgi:hypothetical protein